MTKRLALLSLALLAAIGCRDGGSPPPAPSSSDQAGGKILLEDVTKRSGIGFQHFTGASGQKYLPETLASGICAFDYDGDHRTDVYFVNGAPLGK
ncbi:MAG TPA: CRTAC1 family protein, partial [Candidatus Polarisedimenticolia bacterium]|nr:CRTAC1 family protein [Candidatus Polarisedimenticolia bacterium]